MIEPAIFGRHMALEFVGRVRGGDQDRDAGRVAAIERALRPLQHLKALQIEQIESNTRRAPQILTVAIHSDNVLADAGRASGTDAATEKVGKGAGREMV